MFMMGGKGILPVGKSAGVQSEGVRVAIIEIADHVTRLYCIGEGQIGGATPACRGDSTEVNKKRMGLGVGKWGVSGGSEVSKREVSG